MWRGDHPRGSLATFATLLWWARQHRACPIAAATVPVEPAQPTEHPYQWFADWLTVEAPGVTITPHLRGALVTCADHTAARETTRRLKAVVPRLLGAVNDGSWQVYMYQAAT